MLHLFGIGLEIFLEKKVAQTYDMVVNNKYVAQTTNMHGLQSITSNMSRHSYVFVPQRYVMLKSSVYGR